MTPTPFATSANARRSFGLRLAATVALGAAALPTWAQTTTQMPLRSSTTSALNLRNLPQLNAVSSLRPISQSAATAIQQGLQLANADALARAGQLNLLATAPLPSNCDRRVVAFGPVGTATTFTVRPGQSVVLQGCFGSAPPGEVRLNGLSGGSGYVTLQTVEWKPNFVHAKVPDIKSQFDRDVRLQLKFGDGDFSNELHGKFVALRAKYEISGPSIAQHIEIRTLAALPTGTDFYSWGVSVGGHEGSSAPQSLGPSGVFIATQGPKIGSYFLKPRHPQVALHGYYASLHAGQSQFSNWGPNGEMTLDWATSGSTPASTALHFLNFTKLVIEAPVGTVTGGVLLPN